MAKTVKVSVKFPAAKIKSKVLDDLSKIVKSEDLNRDIGELVSGQIKLAARRGKPLNNSGSFPPLAESTVENRARLSKYNKTVDVYRESRSNLSFTGQLLNSIAYRIKRMQDGSIIEIFFDGLRSPYKTGPKSVAKQTAKNKDNKSLAKTLDSIGFTVFTAKGIEGNETLMRRVRNKVLDFIRRKLR